MKEIELIIKIPEEIRFALINNIQLSIDQQSICDSYIKQAIVNGTLLPKHGRLIDANALNRKDVNCANVPMNFIDTAQTIIEADGDVIKE